MSDASRVASFFKHPQFDWQKRYEALRASFLERLPDKVVADRFGYSHGYIRLLKHNFRHGKLDFSEPVTEKNANRRRVSGEVRRLIRSYREASLSAGQIAELLSEEGFELSVRTVERVLAEEGFPKLPRRTRLQIGMTVRGTTVPDRASIINPAEYNDVAFSSTGAGAFLFTPFLAQLRFDQIVKSARLPAFVPCAQAARDRTLCPLRRSWLRLRPWPFCGAERLAKMYGDVDLLLLARP